LDLAESSPQEIAQALQGVTHVFHLAGAVAGSALELDRANRIGTENLARAAAGLPSLPVFVLVSSAAAGGPSVGRQPRSVEAEPAPISAYGKSKLAGEIAARAFAPQLPLTIVRPGIVFGEGDQEFVKILRAMIRFSINPVIGKGDQPLAMIEVDDLTELLLQAALVGERVRTRWDIGMPWDSCGVYNAGAPEPLNLLEVAEVVRQLTPGRRIYDLHLSPRIAYVTGMISEWASRIMGKASTLNRDKITEGSAPGWALDANKTIQHLNWKPKTNLVDQLRIACLRELEQRLGSTR
jgi:nucleoside-diphosphate-sugar epimerase